MGESNHAGQNSEQRFLIRRSVLGDVLWIVSIAAIYFAAIKLSYLFKAGDIATIWPPIGIFLAALLLTRRNLRPWLVGVLFLTDFSGERLAGTSWFLSAAYSLAVTGDAVLSAWLLLRFVGQPITFRRVRDVLGFLVFAVMLSNALWALLATAATQMGPTTRFWNFWLVWAASEGIGNLLVTPLIVSWATLGKGGWPAWSFKRVLEGAALFIPLAVLNYAAFRYQTGHNVFSLLHVYITFPFLLWAACRFGIGGVNAALLILAAIAIPFAAAGQDTALSPGASHWNAVILVQLYLAILAIPSLLLAAVVAERQENYAALQLEMAERQRTEAALRQRNGQLDVLARASRQINAVLEIPVVLRRLVASALELTGATAGTAGRLIGNEMVFSEYNRQGALLAAEHRFVENYGVPGWIMHTHAPYVTNDAAHDPHVVPEIQQTLGFHNLADVPILDRSGALLGCFEIHNKQGGFTDQDLLVMQSLAATAAIAMENASLLEERQRAQELLQSQAKHLEQLVQERTTELQENVGELEAFSYTIAHDMRAPLRAIIGFTQMLRRQCKDQVDETGAEYLNRIIDAARRMDRLIQDVLSLSQLTRAQFKLEPVDTDKVLQGILSSYPAFQPPQVEIQVQRPLPIVLANEAALTQCISNLLGNAVKFVAPGVRPHIEIWAEELNPPDIKGIPASPAPQPLVVPSVRLWFADNGVGIDPDQLERIFEIFQRVDTSYEGTGIGLAIVRKAMQRMGGKVGVESQVGKGSRFWLEFPSPASGGKITK